ncbi:tetratricopeptide repeat protein [bacterium]|nr:tetratricopeptide repeat protein [bacterium]
MRNPILIISIFCLMFALSGCSSRQVKALEEQMDREKVENEMLTQEVDSLRALLIKKEAQVANLREGLTNKNAVIEEQEQSMNELRLEYLELKTSLEGDATGMAQEEPAGQPAVQEVKKPPVQVQSVTPPVPKPVQVSSSGDYQTDYRRGYDLFNEGKYNDAGTVFNSLIQRNRDHDLADNAQFWLGECHYALKQYESALAEFEKVFIYPNSNKSDAAQFKIGLCWYNMGRYPEAKEQLIRLLSNYPGSEYVPRSRDLLDKIP